MRAFVGVLFLVLAVPTVAQAPSPESILIGDIGEVRLFLGQSKESALRTLREHFDVGVEDDKTGQAAIFSQGSLSPGAKVGIHYGWVTFRSGKVSAVTKLWDIQGLDTGIAVVRAIRGAMSSFGKSGQACTVVPFDDQGPSMEKSGVVVSCGMRQVQVFVNRWAFKTGSGEGVVINEVLSEP